MLPGGPSCTWPPKMVTTSIPVLCVVLVVLFERCSCFANGVLPELSYLPPGSDNVGLAVGTPAIATPQSRPPLHMLLPAIDLPQSEFSSGNSPANVPVNSLGDSSGLESGAQTEPPTTTDSPESSNCSKACPFSYQPMCGSDGITYTNNCTFSVAMCKYPNLTLEGFGSCDSQAASADPPTCDRQCTKIFNPVCGSDGHSYNSPCLLEIASCEIVNSGGAPVTLAFTGSCDTAADDSRGSSFALSTESQQDTCPEECTKIYTPVCGTDGLTYNNECILKIAACKSALAGGDAIYKDYDGTCVAVLPTSRVCEGRCENTYSPVCGSDGETYNNVCLLNLANCHNQVASITLASNGTCDSQSAAGLSTDPRPQISTAPREYIPPL